MNTFLEKLITQVVIDSQEAITAGKTNDEKAKERAKYVCDRLSGKIKKSLIIEGAA